MLRILGGALMIFATLAFGANAGAEYAGAEDAGAEDADARALTDFEATSPVTWYTVNDGVMGGRSQGGFRLEDGELVFAGTTNTNGGGFSSIRTRERAFDLEGFDGIRLRVKADGRRYTFRLTTSTTRQGRYVPSYWADFETRDDGSWETVDVPFARFVPRWRGRTLSGPALQTGKIDSLGLMIYDKRDGAFHLNVDWIRAYRTEPAVDLASFRGQNRLLVISSPDPEDPRVLRQRAAIERTRELFDDRDLKEIVRAADAFAIRLIGKDGGVKHTSDEVVDMPELYALIDTMPLRQQEMKREPREP